MGLLGALVQRCASPFPLQVEMRGQKQNDFLIIIIVFFKKMSASFWEMNEGV
jgi:hypothetical protein